MDRLDHRWSGLFFCLFFPAMIQLQAENKKSLRFLVQSNEFKNVFLTYYSRYCFYRTRNRPERDSRSKTIFGLSIGLSPM